MQKHKQKRPRVAKRETRFSFKQAANNAVAIYQPIAATAAIQTLFN